MPKIGEETMLKWFQSQYEDAAEGIFFNSREGGYQYEEGNRPCDPSTVLQEEFPDADFEIVKRVADGLSREGTPWVKKYL